MCFFFQAEDGIRDLTVTGVQTCALPISQAHESRGRRFLGKADPEAARGVERSRETFHRRGFRSHAYRRRHADAGGRAFRDRKSVVEGKSVDLGGRRIIKKKKKISKKVFP